jgi:hypothetical protein
VPDDDDRRAILDRRARLIAIALGGFSAGCYESHTVESHTVVVDAGVDSGVPMPCLSRPLEDAGTPQPCLDAPLDSGTPQPCLGVAIDGGRDDGGSSDGGGDAGPLPCLTI